MKEEKENNLEVKQLGQKDYSWGNEQEGLLVGLWISPLSDSAENLVDVRVAVLNNSKEVIKLEPDFSLKLQVDDEEIVFGEGPRSSTAIAINPTEFLEMAGWQITEVEEFKSKTCMFQAMYNSRIASGSLNLSF